MTDTPDSPPAFLVANLKIKDPDGYRAYEKGFFPLFKRHGGEYLTFDDAPDTLEGEAPRQGRMIIGRFPSEAAARAFYADADYQALSERRRSATKLEFLTIVRGLSGH